MCRCEVCKLGKVRKKQQRDKKEGSTRLRGVTGRERGAGCLDEDETKTRDSMLGETAVSPPQEHRNSPCSHADVAVEVAPNGTSRMWAAAS